MIEKKIMTTRELAEYIKLHEKTVLKMAQNGQIPGMKIGNQWRFHLSSIDNYLQDEIVHAPENELEMLIHTTDNIIPLSRLIEPSLIFLSMKATTIPGVLRELAGYAQSAGMTPDADVLYRELKEREGMLSTAIGNSVAIPHPRNPDKKLFSTPNIILCRSRAGIEYGAHDNKKVHLFFMTCSPSIAVHLRLLAKIAKLLQIPGMSESLIKAEDTKDVIRILLQNERIKIPA